MKTFGHRLACLNFTSTSEETVFRGCHQQSNIGLGQRHYSRMEGACPIGEGVCPALLDQGKKMRQN
eukprot:scaffold58083_cov33-Prasinocladus_malaysianus.AAC.2